MRFTTFVITAATVFSAMQGHAADNNVPEEPLYRLTGETTPMDEIPESERHLIRTVPSIMEQMRKAGAKQPISFDKKEQMLVKHVEAMAASVRYHLKSCKEGGYLYCELTHMQADKFAKLLNKHDFKLAELNEDKQDINDALAYSKNAMDEYKAKLIERFKKDGTYGNARLPKDMMAEEPDDQQVLNSEDEGTDVYSVFGASEDELEVSEDIWSSQ